MNASESPTRAVSSCVRDVTAARAVGRGVTSPSLRSTVHTLAAERVREVCVVPVAFVSDHVETLGEIDHEARELARRLGFTQFEMSAGLNDSPKFVEALAQIVEHRLGRTKLGKTRLAAETLAAVG